MGPSTWSCVRGVDSREGRGGIPVAQSFSFITPGIRSSIHENLAVRLIIGVDSGLPGAAPMQMSGADIFRRPVAVGVLLYGLSAVFVVSFPRCAY